MAPLILPAGGSAGASSLGEGGVAGGEGGVGASAGAGGSSTPELGFSVAEDTTQRGPFTTDTPTHRDLCPTGSVLVGLNAQLDQEVVGQLQGVCGALQLSDVGALHVAIAPGATLELRGGASGMPVTRLCPQDNVVVGFEGRSGALFDELVLRCAPLLVAEHTIALGEPILLEPIGNPGGSAFELTECTGSAVAAGVQTSSDHWIVGFGLTCANVTLTWESP